MERFTIMLPKGLKEKIQEKSNILGVSEAEVTRSILFKAFCVGDFDGKEEKNE